MSKRRIKGQLKKLTLKEHKKREPKRAKRAGSQKRVPGVD